MIVPASPCWLKGDRIYLGRTRLAHNMSSKLQQVRGVTNWVQACESTSRFSQRCQVGSGKLKYIEVDVAWHTRAPGSPLGLRLAHLGVD